MKLLTFTYPDGTRTEERRAPRVGSLIGQVVVDLAVARTWAPHARGLPADFLPGSLFEVIHDGPSVWQYARDLIQILEGENPEQLIGVDGMPVGSPLSEIILFPPLPRPMSVRDFYAFEQHVAAARATRGAEVPPEWYAFPVFYFSNSNAIFGPDEVIPYPAYTQELDYELEVACIIGKPGINISTEHAGEYIFGYSIFNDWSARDEQRKEVRVGLGPAKAKDFASSLGPSIVTPDELQAQATPRPGVFDLTMVARVNGEERSHGNLKDLHYSFGEMIARASQDAYLLPGDVICSGTVGTGCLLEVTQGRGPWLQPGDLVELEVEGLGILRNRVGKAPRSYE